MDNQNETAVATETAVAPVAQKRRGRPLSETGFAGQCRAIVAANPGLDRQGFLKLAAGIPGLAATTASVYWNQLKPKADKSAS